MKIDFSFLHSKIAVRIFLLFGICALIPITTFAILSYSKVTKQLYEQSQKNLHLLNKTLGMTFIDRLLFLEAEMKMVASKASRSDSTPYRFSGEFREQLKEHFTALALFNENGKNIPVLGQIGALPKLTPEERQYIKSGKTLLLNQNNANRPSLIDMVRMIPPYPDGGFMTGEVNNSFLWGLPDRNNLTGLTEFSVLDDSNHLLITSMPGFTAFPEEVIVQINRSSSGQFEWANGRTGYLASYWSMFLKEYFFIPKWTVVVTQSKADVYSSAINFINVFPLVIIMSILMVMLISIGQIRKRFKPLLLLKEGTRRIAMKDFTTKVTVKSGDEFEEVADSFNIMAEQLGKQINTLTTMGEIQNAILSTLDSRKIMEIIIKHIPSIFPCNYISTTVISLNDKGLAESKIRCCETQEEYLAEHVKITSNDMKELINNPQYLSIKGDLNIPSYLQPLVGCGIKSFYIFPIFLNRSLTGFITLGNINPPLYSKEDLSQIRQLTDQIAVALSNAFMVQKTYTLAYYDKLTNLPNLLLFKERLNEMLLYAEFHKKILGIIVLDIDHFKRVNDTLGHSLGDELLCHISKRLTDCINKSGKDKALKTDGNMIAHFGGDEFIILSSDVTQILEVTSQAENILNSFSQQFSLRAHNLFITASIGIALYPADGEEIDNLIKNADTAMHFAKSSGRNNYKRFTAAMNNSALEKFSFGNDLRLALEREEFEVYYQANLEAQTRQIIGMEALVRWRHPKKGIIYPAIFIPLAEELGLIFRLGEQVLRTACVQTKAWHALGLPKIRVAVNLSSYQFRHGNLKETILRALSDSGLSPEYLELELTESAIMENAEVTIHTLQEWKEMGIHLVVDDFGTGYSSLTYLKRFPLDKLKIDRAFVIDITSNPDDAAIVTAIIAMAHSLNLKVTAEGVETEEQLTFLLARGCDEIQGYLFGQALPADAFEMLLRKVKNKVWTYNGRKDN